MSQVSLRRALSVAVLSLTAAALAVVPVGTSTAASQASVTTDPVRVGTYNIRSGVSLTDFKSAVDKLKTISDPPDVIGLQEIGLNDKNHYLREDIGWGYYSPEQVQQNPIIWRRDRFDLVGTRGHMIAKARDLGNEYRGGEEKDDSYATVVRLVDRATGEQMSFINIHFIRGAVRGGKRAPEAPKMYGLFTDQVAGTVDAIKQERAASDQVFVMGDFNVGYKADIKRKVKKLPYRQFTKKLGMNSMWKKSPYLDKSYGTHSDALLDQVWTFAAPGDVHEEIRRDITASDHFPAVATAPSPTSKPGWTPVDGTISLRNVACQEPRTDCREGDGLSRTDAIISVDGDLRRGHVRVEVMDANGENAAIRGEDFTIDTSALYDTDLSNGRIVVDFLGDDKEEGDETFTLRLVDPVNTRIIQATISVTIVNDDK